MKKGYLFAKARVPTTNCLQYHMIWVLNSNELTMLSSIVMFK